MAPALLVSLCFIITSTWKRSRAVGRVQLLHLGCPLRLPASSPVAKSTYFLRSHHASRKGPTSTTAT